MPGPNDEAGSAIVLRTRLHLRRMGDSNPRGREPNTLSKSGDGRSGVLADVLALVALRVGSGVDGGERP